jgi:ubiquitin carboxyl-terminal hydrolase 4/11/15
VTAAAYLLFYRRRSDSSLGGRILQNITDPSVRPTTDSDSPTESHTESPSGEGRRLGGSSRNGSSGALIGVGAAHQAGVGGLRAVTQVRNGEDDDDAMPPEYSNGLPTGEQTLETVHCSDDMELIEDIFHGNIHPNSLQFENEMWPLESAADPVGASQITKAPPGSYCEDEDSFDDNSSNKAVRGGDLSDSDIRLGTTSAGSPDDSGAPFPSTSFEDPPVRVISPPSDVDDAN